MVRPARALLCAALACGLMLLAARSPAPALAQDKAKEKEKAKPKPPRIAINDPEKLKDDKDFATQGEYTFAGTTDAGEYKISAQVVAKGSGQFDVYLCDAGLPGDGWDAKAVTRATATLGDDGTAAVTGKDVAGKIAAGKFTVKAGTKAECTLAKVARTSITLGAKPPEGATVLFGKDGDEKENWNGGKLIELSDGKFLNTGIKTKKEFRNFTAHIEFRLPWMPNSTGQGRGNSGFYMQDRYELQILDSFGLKGENNECGGIYTQHKPLINMCYPPMAWQTYDIDFTAATYDGDKKTANARVTVKHNGVTIHDNADIKGSTGGGKKEDATPGPIQLQNHGDPFVFRNVWIVEGK